MMARGNGKQSASANPEKVLLYYSPSLHFEQAKTLLRQRFPKSRLWAAFPPAKQDDDVVREGLSGIVPIPKDGLRPVRDFAVCAKLLGSIRREKFDLIVILFDSYELKVFALLSGCRRHAVINSRLEFHTLNLGICRAPQVILGRPCRVILGRIVFAALRTCVAVWGFVRKEDPHAANRS